MAKFIAIPVGQGDAFYLEADNYSFLVDGGKSRLAFPGLFHKATGKTQVDVVVCSHNDADHANGILGYLEGGLRCREVWLPGRWLGVLHDVLRPFADVSVKLHGDVEEIERHFPGGSDKAPQEIEEYAALEDYQKDTMDDHNDVILLGDDGWPENLTEALEQAMPWSETVGISLWPYMAGPPFLPYYIDNLRPESIRLLWSALDAAQRIRDIAVAAFHRGVAVRWFEYNPSNPSGGLPSRFEPLNSKEIVRIKPISARLLYRLALTVSNRESLVFWAPPNKQHPAVLFNADSDLSGVTIPAGVRGAIATAPHHGSEANANAYAMIQAASPSSVPITWIRSDGRYKSRPGPSYLALTTRRLCTLCRSPMSQWGDKQTVLLVSRSGFWVRYSGTRVCKCR